MNRSSLRALLPAALAVLVSTVLPSSPGMAATLSDAKHSVPDQTLAKPQPKVTLPARSDVLVVDWVDTKHAKIAIGGITYLVAAGALPAIVLSGGERVTNIGYLKSGMQVKIRTAADGAGFSRLVEITVVG